MLRISEETAGRPAGAARHEIRDGSDVCATLRAKAGRRGAEPPEPGSGASHYIRAVLADHDVRGERAVAYAQGCIALFVLLLHLGARIGSDLAPANGFVIAALAALALSSWLRLRLTRLPTLPERTLNILSVFDIALFLMLVWAYQFAYEHPAGAVLKAPSLALLFALVASRALRFHPLPILVTGVAACAGLVLVVLAAIYKEGAESITKDYTVYLTSFAVLLGAEIERLVSLAALVICLAVGASAARSLLYRLDTTIEHMPQGVAVFGPDDRIIAYNSLFGHLYALTSKELKPGVSLPQLLRSMHEKGVFGDIDFDRFLKKWMEEAEARQSRIQELSDGRIYAITRRSMADGGFVSTTEDVTEQLEMKLLAHHDPLTGLPNRRKLSQILDRLANGQRAARSGAVLCLDLDRFKEVNDRMGHHAGDELLKAAAKRLQLCVRDDDTVVRTGGDEFVIVMSSPEPEQAASNLAQRIIEEFEQPFEVDAQTVNIGASVGVVIFGGASVDPELLLKRADMALYRAKQDGRGAYRFYNDDDESVCSGPFHRCEVRQAIQQGGLQACFAPILDTGSGHIAGFEMYPHWTGSAEDAGKSGPDPGEFCGILGEWLIEEGCKMASALPDGMSVTVNLIGNHLRHQGLAGFVPKALDRHGVAPGRLIVELHEEAFLSRCKAVARTLQILRRIGVEVSLDRFGAGYSAPLYVGKFPFDRLKIAPSVTRDLAGSELAAGKLKAILDFAVKNDIAATAEGVASLEDYEIVKRLGCAYAQGAFCGTPLPAAAALAMVQKTNGPDGRGRDAVLSAS